MYVKTNWEDDKDPPIDADNLNKIEDCLVELTDRDVIDVIAQSVTWSRGKLARFGHSCMFDLEFRAPISVGGETDIFQFPDGYKPFMNFALSVVNSNDGTFVGICSYDSARNVLSFRSNTQDEVMTHFYCSYITADKSIQI